MSSFPGPQNWFLVKIHRDSFLRPQNEMGAIVRKVAGVATADSESPTRWQLYGYLRVPSMVRKKHGITKVLDCRDSKLVLGSWQRWFKRKLVQPQLALNVKLAMSCEVREKTSSARFGMRSKIKLLGGRDRLGDWLTDNLRNGVRMYGIGKGQLDITNEDYT